MALSLVQTDLRININVNHRIIGGNLVAGGIFWRSLR